MSEEHLEKIAVKTLVNVCNDVANTGSARAAAARTLLEYIGEVGRLQEPKANSKTQALSEMSAADLDKEIARLSVLAKAKANHKAPNVKSKAKYRLL